MATRPEFNPDKDFVVVKWVKASGREFSAGDMFDKSLVDPRRLRQMYECRQLCYPEQFRAPNGKAPHLEDDHPYNAIPIPDDWDLLPWPERRRLASLLSESPVLNKADAEAAIKSELQRRDELPGDAAQKPDRERV